MKPDSILCHGQRFGLASGEPQQWWQLAAPQTLNPWLICGREL